MVRIIYEHPVDWPQEGLLRVDAHLQGEVAVSPDTARHRANGYFNREVALFLIAGEPELILGEQALWRVPAILRLRGFGEIAAVGSMSIDALSGEPIPLSPEQIDTVRERANDLANRLAPTADTTS